MAQSNRTDNLVGNTGVKRPVAVATTANITLSGEQTVDDIAVVDGDRVLVKDQTDGIENGIYVANTGTWVRAPDCDGVYDLVEGTLIKANAGTANSGFWYCSTTGTIVVGTTSIAFAGASTILAVVSAYMQTMLDDANAAAARVTLGQNAQILWSGTAGGSADALTLTPTPAAESLTTGLTVLFKSGAAANTGATTLAVSGLAATAVQVNGAACAGAEIAANQWYMALYDGSAFQLSPIGGFPHLLGQVQFPATQRPSADPNTLDDYAGPLPWTPLLTDESRDDEGQTGTFTGRYTKIGNIVFIECWISMLGLGSMTAGNNAFITGLPFTSLNVSGLGANLSVGQALNLAITAGNSMVGHILPNTDEIALQLWDATTGVTTMLISEVTSGGAFSLSGFYMAAA